MWILGPYRHQTQVKWTRVLSNRNQVLRTWFSFASFASTARDKLPCSSKPQKPMNKTKYKTQNKYPIGSDFPRLKLSPLGFSQNRRLGYFSSSKIFSRLQCVLLLHWSGNNITRAAVRNHTHIKSNMFSLRNHCLKHSPPGLLHYCFSSASFFVIAGYQNQALQTRFSRYWNQALKTRFSCLSGQISTSIAAWCWNRVQCTRFAFQNRVLWSQVVRSPNSFKTVLTNKIV